MLGDTSPKETESKKVAGFNQSQEPLSSKKTVVSETYFWSKILTSTMDTILYFQAPGGGQQFIGLAVNTLRQQMAEQGIDNPDELLQILLQNGKELLKVRAKVLRN